MIHLRTRPSVFAAGAVALFAAAALIVDAPRFAPKEGSSVKRTLTMKGTRDLKSVTMKAGGEEQTSSDAHLHFDISSKYVVVDEFTSVADFEVKKLTRTFESLTKNRTETSQEPKSGEEKHREIPETCELEGKSVVFTWNAAKEEYDVAFKDGTRDEKLLGKLEMDMDYRGFLPKAGAEVGAKWTVDLAEIKGAMFHPSGELPFHGEKEMPALDRRMRDALWESTKGEMKLELQAARDEDGIKVAVITFKGSFDSDAGTEREEGEKGPAKMHAVDAQTFEGELLWNAAAGRPHALSWRSEGSLRLVVLIGKAKNKEGEEVEIEQTLLFDEEYAYSAKMETP